FATEHGPSGELNGWCCHDEVNVIVKGNNYGWPKVIGDDIATGSILPFAHSGEDTWAPGGIIYVDDFNEQNKEIGCIIFACLRGERLVQFDINKNQTITSPINKDEKQLFPQNYGRLRNIILAPDGSIVFSTSNEDGRGNAEKNDDRIMIMYQ
ncbi:MAG: PQQ-dependent sugar dehydrogenase, partial [Chitinophagales bacterium]|nr:PQQ-dependent sugar dehydrogenase [Chitinophagales bacterium]